MRGATKQATLWCRWYNPTTKKTEYYRYTLPRCSWEDKVVTGISGTGAVASNVYSVLIDFDPNYRPKIAWDDLSEAERRQYWTLAPGDLMAKGDVEFEITGVSPNTQADLRKNMGADAFAITAVVDAAEGYKRGRHYSVSGV